MTRYGIGPAAPEYWAQCVFMQGNRLLEHKADVERLLLEAGGASDLESCYHLTTRVSRAQTDASIDARLLVYAIHHLIRLGNLMVEDATGRTKDRASVALVKFNAAWPGVKDARDMVEHFDEYVIGKGKRRRLGDLTKDESGTTHFGAITEDVVGRWHFALYDVDLPLGEFIQASLALAGALAAAWPSETFGLDAEVEPQPFAEFDAL